MIRNPMNQYALKFAGNLVETNLQKLKFLITGHQRDLFVIVFWLLSLFFCNQNLLAQGNLLRNSDFQDDWITYIPELKNHHWNYTTEVFNRRDYNPDGWKITGSWEWRDADKPRGQRKLILNSPSKVTQAVNWIAIHNPKKLAGWPDAGGYPSVTPLYSSKPLSLVRDLVFSAKISGKDVPKDAVSLLVSWSNVASNEPATPKSAIATVKIPVPEGTYSEKIVPVKLDAATWLEIAMKDKTFPTMGALLPMGVVCEIEYASGKGGSIELLETSLFEPGPSSPNLFSNGDFESDNMGYPQGWSKAQRYRYFPPGIYYIFNTWHNSNSDNRGTVAVDHLSPFSGKSCLQMSVPTGDETCVISDPIVLNQKEIRPIEVSAWIKTHQLCMLQLDAEDENGQRINGFNYIHKNPLSFGNSDWRQIRQVFSSDKPLKSIRLKLCARGMNGYTLGGTGHQPQQNAFGVVWWDDVKVFEPESSIQDLSARGVVVNAKNVNSMTPHLANLDLGEQLLGVNHITAQIKNPGADADFYVQMQWMDGSEVAPIVSGPIKSGNGKPSPVSLAYTLSDVGKAYKEKPFTLTLLDAKKAVVTSSNYSVSTWTVPIDLELGSLYMQPNQKQFVRVNFGLTNAEMARIKELKLDVVEKTSSKVLKSFIISADPASIAKQRTKIPVGVLDDLRNMLITDLDVSFLPLQSFDNPMRNWFIRASTINSEGKSSWVVDSSAFCRLAHDAPQPAIESVKINEFGDFLINGKPWMPWGVAYGHNPVYDGPAESGKYYDLANLKPWNLYDRYGGNLKSRELWDTNCERHVEIPKFYTQVQLEALWKQGLYTSTAFMPPKAKPWPMEHLKYLSTAPMVASVSPGPEEAFAYFTPMTQKQLDEVKADVDLLRSATGKPVMVGHGGYWNRLELERATFFDVFDPETEPWYPAPVHTDLKPLIEGQKKTIWLRPQMYESVPYERWRYHVYVELMRGARGWQVAHGPSDPSVFRGLQAELRHLQPLIYSHEKTPAVSISPPLENMVRKAGNKTILIAASTHGLTFGNYRHSLEKSPAGKSRVTADPHIFRDESDGYHAPGGEPASLSWVPHGVQYLVDPRKYAKGSKLVTWVKLDAKAPPKNLMAFVKADGRWTYAASFGEVDLASLRNNNEKAFWFLRTFYRHARGFLGWGDKVEPYAKEFLPASAATIGNLPPVGDWVKLEIPLEKISAVDKLVDGVAFAHDGGRVWWANTVIVGPDGKESLVFGDHEDRPDPDSLIKTKLSVEGLKKGTVIKVLFENRTIVADDGFFIDDFSGVDLYQRYGGERLGYGSAPVALHVYQIGE
ncbi:MAG: hypothetical protein EBQ87_15750 [Planctomycetes bacterium]|nr:hypothetical protein [Planctomycetota bacterium]